MVLLELDVAGILLAAVQLEEEGVVQVTIDVIEKLGHCLRMVAVESLVRLGWRGFVMVFVAGSFKTWTHVISGLELVLLQLAVAFSNSEIAFVLSNVLAVL